MGSTASKDGSYSTVEAEVIHSGNWRAMNAIPIHEEIQEVEIEEVPLSAKLLSCLFFPLLPLVGFGAYTVDAKTEAAVLHMGQLTEMQKTPGLHCGYPCGREIRYVSTKQRTMELPSGGLQEGAPAHREQGAVREHQRAGGTQADSGAIFVRAAQGRPRRGQQPNEGNPAAAHGARGHRGLFDVSERS